MNLKINDRIKIRNIDFFNGFEVDLKYDSLGSTFSFNTYFDPKNKEHAELSCVSHFHEAIVEHDGETLITGYILSQAFNQGPKKELTQFAGYSKPGVLEDCEIPTSLYPLQTDGLTFRQITQKLIAPFNLKLVVDEIARADAGTAIVLSDKKREQLDKKIEKSTAAESQNIKSYLTELATQRNLVLSHNEKGDVRITEANTQGKPLFHVEKGVIATAMSMSFNGQGIHSHITVIKEADEEGGNAGEYTIANPYCPIVYRPKVITLSSGDDISIEEAAINALAAELKNITFTFSLDRWDVDGKIIRPNNTITVFNPEIFIYKKTTLFIQSVKLKGDSKQMTAVLTCVPIEAYNGKVPKNMFVDPHENLPRL